MASKLRPEHHVWPVDCLTIGIASFKQGLWRDNPQITSVIACMLNCPMVVFLRISPRKYLRKKWFSVWPLVTASSWQISWISPHISFLKMCLLFNYYCIIRTICLAYRTDTSVYGDQSEGKPSLRLYTS